MPNPNKSLVTNKEGSLFEKQRQPKPMFLINRFAKREIQKLYEATKLYNLTHGGRGLFDFVVCKTFTQEVGLVSFSPALYFSFTNALPTSKEKENIANPIKNIPYKA